MAANIRTINEFPPKFAHHVTLYTATKELVVVVTARVPGFPPFFAAQKLTATCDRPRGERDCYVS